MAELTKLVIAMDLAPWFVERIRADYPDLDVVVCPDPEQLPQALQGAQAMVGGRLTPDLLAQEPSLGWYHSGGTGVDSLLVPELVASDVIVTNSRGGHSENIAEHVLGLMIAFARDLPRLILAQHAHEWAHGTVTVFELSGQTLGIVGLGNIGRGLAWRAAGIGMRVIGLKRRPGRPPTGVERVYLTDELPELLAQSDHVAICIPLTAHTRGLIGANELAAMKPTAYLYNVGRGPIVDQPALIEALRAGRIAGAGLDVTDPEPLPPDSPLWDMPNVIMTGHTSGFTPLRWERGIGILLENIGRYRRGEPMLNLVDKREGY